MWWLLFLLIPAAMLWGWRLGKKYTDLSSQKNKSNFSSQYFAGLNYLLNEQSDKAVDIFLQVLDVDNEMVETHLTLGNLFRQKGEVDRAIKIHQSLLAKASITQEQRALACLELAKDYIRAGMLDRAEKLLLELYDMQFYIEVALTHLLNIYQQSRDWQNAIDIAEKLQLHNKKKSLGAQIAHFYCELAQQAWIAGHVDIARYNLKLAYRANRKCARASILHGNIEAGLGHYQDAISFYQLVQEQDPIYFSEVIQAMGRCYEAMGHREGMYTYLQQCILQMPQTSVALAYCDWLSEKKSISTAMKFLADYLEKHPTVQGLNKVIQLNLQMTSGKIYAEFQMIKQLIDKILSKRPLYRCENCGFSSKVLEWHCPGCKQWDTIKPLVALESLGDAYVI